MSQPYRAHVHRDDLALYVVGALDGAHADEVEAHVLVCDVCADALSHEARFEAAFDEVARRAIERTAIVHSSLAASRAARRNGRFMGGVAGALAAAAAIVLMFSETSRADSGPATASTVAQVHSQDGAAGDMSGALMAEVRTDKLDGG